MTLTKWGFNDIMLKNLNFNHNGGIKMVGLIVFVLSIILTSFILKIINKNTIGTQRAYIARAIAVWAISFAIISYIFGKLGFL